MAKFTKAQIDELLQSEMREQQQAYLRAKSEFDAVAKSRVDLLQLDSIRRLRKAGARYRVALLNYTSAIKEHSGFLSNGEVPERFGK